MSKTEPQNQKTMKVTLLLGTVRQERQSHRAANYLAKALDKRGNEADLIDLARIPLPILGGPDENDPQLKNNIKTISGRLKAANALILATPEYHGSLSGVLKNAIDHFWEEFQKKPVGVVAASAGRMAGINASTQLQHIILSLGAYPVPLKLLIPEIQNAFDDDYVPQNEKIVTSTERFLEEFLWFADALDKKKQADKEKEWSV
jgi:azobenzene reductase